MVTTAATTRVLSASSRTVAGGSSVGGEGEWKSGEGRTIHGWFGERSARSVKREAWGRKMQKRGLTVPNIKYKQGKGRSVEEK